MERTQVNRLLDAQLMESEFAALCPYSCFYPLLVAPLVFHGYFYLSDCSFTFYGY